MGKFISAIVVVGVIAAVLIFGGAFYIVDESEQVVITQFGKPVGEPITNPGLKIKKPFLETANYFDKRFLAWDGEPKQVSTRDKRFININTYARWRISDPLQYAKRLFDESKALTRLGSVLEGATQNAIANHDLIELVRSTNRDYVIDSVDNETVSVSTNMQNQLKAGDLQKFISGFQILNPDVEEIKQPPKKDADNKIKTIFS